MSLGDIAWRSGEWLHNAWSQRPAGLLPLLLGGLFVAIAFLLFGDPRGEKTTLGTIVVSSPAIYTRERLVNDRFLQDSWLSAQLEPTSGIQDALQIRDEHRGATFQVGEGKDSADWQPGGGQATSAPNAADRKPRLSSRAQLLEQVDYREVVRNLTIENQLDDRHDLNGNSLYRFKFDASVLPGANTQASAIIEVRLTTPAFLTLPAGAQRLENLVGLDSREVDAWRVIYTKWIESLSSRLNDTYQELSHAFHSGELSHNDYADLIALMVKNLNVVRSQIPKCPSHLVDPEGPERAVFRLTTQEHIARKQCLEAIVDHSILPNAIAALPSGTKPREYIPQLAPTVAPSSFDRSVLARKTLDLWIGSFFGTKTVKLVLGVAVPEMAFFGGGRGLYTVPAFRNLARLTFFNGLTPTEDGNVFDVYEKVFPVAAIDPARMSKEDIARIGETREEFRGQKLEAFVPVSFAAGLRVSRSHLDALKGEDFVFSEKAFRELSDCCKGAYVAGAEVGLLNFIRAARPHVRAFTYGVTPKESADSIDLTLSADSRVEGQAPGVGDRAAAAARLRREATSRTLERRTAVVGFAGTAKETSVAEFGWIISPRLTTLDGQRHVYVQTPAQYALSALVSIPSWWNKARFQVKAGWIGKDGERIAKPEMTWDYVVDVPMDFEPLEALLLGIDQLGPELMQSRLDPIQLTAFCPGAVVIPGRRLWRSTKVTVGYQTADSISVLPNMKGIIAKFERVQNQMSLEEESKLRKKDGGVEIQRTVRVWTSQGTLTLPRPALIGIPSKIPSECVPASAQKPVADKPVASTK